MTTMTTEAAAERRDYRCNVCDARGDKHCICDGWGTLTRSMAERFLAPGEALIELPPVPETMPSPCHDCAFRGDSPEHENADLRASLRESVRKGRPFYCHQGMHTTEGGRYVPRATGPDGAPVGHPVCAGWAAARLRLDLKRPTTLEGFERAVREAEAKLAEWEEEVVKTREGAMEPCLVEYAEGVRDEARRELSEAQAALSAFRGGPTGGDDARL